MNTQDVLDCDVYVEPAAPAMTLPWCAWIRYDGPGSDGRWVYCALAPTPADAVAKVVRMATGLAKRPMRMRRVHTEAAEVFAAAVPEEKRC